MTCSILLLLTLNGCNEVIEDEGCEERIDLGSYSISDETKANFPFNQASKVIVSDSLGIEYVGEIVVNSSSYSSNKLTAIVCNNTPYLEFIVYDWTHEFRTVSINFEEIGVGIDVRIRLVGRINDNNEFQYGEKLSCTISEWGINSWWTEVSLPLMNTSLNPPLSFESEFYDTIKIHDKVFTDVHGKEDNYNIYYNNEIGIIGFTEFIPYGTYKFERIE